MDGEDERAVVENDLKEREDRLVAAKSWQLRTVRGGGAAAESVMEKAARRVRAAAERAEVESRWSGVGECDGEGSAESEGGGRES